MEKTEKCHGECQSKKLKNPCRFLQKVITVLTFFSTIWSEIFHLKFSPNMHLTWKNYDKVIKISLLFVLFRIQFFRHIFLHSLKVPMSEDFQSFIIGIFASEKCH